MLTPQHMLSGIVSHPMERCLRFEKRMPAATAELIRSYRILQVCGCSGRARLGAILQVEVMFQGFQHEGLLVIRLRIPPHNQFSLLAPFEVLKC